MDKIKKFYHKIKHHFGWHTGKVYSELRNGEVWIGFKCDVCNKVEGLHCAEDVIKKSLSERSSLRKFKLIEDYYYYYPETRREFKFPKGLIFEQDMHGDLLSINAEDYTDYDIVRIRKDMLIEPKFQEIN